MASKKAFRIGLAVSAALGTTLACSRADVPMPTPIEEEQAVQVNPVARGFSVLGGLDSEQPIEELIVPVSTQITIPVQTEEELFLEQLDGFKENYGFDVAAWEEAHTKDPEVIKAILEDIPEEERSRTVLQFFSDIALLNMVKNFIKHDDYAEQDCWSGTSWYLHRERGLYCRELPEWVSLGAPTAHEDGFFIGTVEGEEVAPVLEQKRSGLLERITGTEDTVEIILAEQLDDSFERLIGERADVQLEFEVNRLGIILVYDSLDDSIITSINYQKPFSEEALEELDEIFASSERYTYSLSNIGGLSTTPVMVLSYPYYATTTQHIITALSTAGHEMTHRILIGYPVKYIPGEPGSQIEETLAEIYGWQAAKDVIDHDYTAESVGADYALRFQDNIEVAFDKEGNFLNPYSRMTIGTDGRAEELVHARYGTSPLSRQVIELYNCIAHPYDAFQLFKVMDSPDDVEEQLEICLTKGGDDAK